MTFDLAIQQDSDKREQFLEWLLSEKRKAIASTARRVLGPTAPQELVHGECVQAFLIAANRAIDRVRVQDDGRGKNNPIAWIITKGLHGVFDFLRLEYGLHRTNNYAQRRFESNQMLYGNFLLKTGENDWDDYLIPHPLDYAEHIVSYISFQEFSKTLSPIERQIAEIVIQYRTTHKLAWHIGQSIGIKPRSVSYYLRRIRQKLEKLTS